MHRQSLTTLEPQAYSKEHCLSHQEAAVSQDQPHNLRSRAEHCTTELPGPLGPPSIQDKRWILQDKRHYPHPH